MNPLDQYIKLETRRQFFLNSGVSLGAAALATMLAGRTGGSTPAQAANGGLPGLPHHTPKAKRAIYLFMSGAPSQMEMYDYKPVMADWYDRDLPGEIRMGQRLTTMTSGQARFPIAPSMYKFHQHGQNGTWASELLPHMGSVVSRVFGPRGDLDPAVRLVLRRAPQDDGHVGRAELAVDHGAVEDSDVLAVELPAKPLPVALVPIHAVAQVVLGFRPLLAIGRQRLR